MITDRTVLEKEFENAIKSNVRADIMSGELDTTYAEIDGQKDAAKSCADIAIRFAINILNKTDLEANKNYYRASIERNIELLQSLLK